GERMAGFPVERLDFRTQDSDGFMLGLERNGPKAIREFNTAF
ncbi:MAG: deiodinase-related protein, partial [Anaerolineales bacterium]